MQANILVDLAVEANLALTIFIGVGVYLLWREVFPSLVRTERRQRRSEMLRRRKNGNGDP